MLNCRRLDLPWTAAKMLTTILNNTIYKLKTGHDLSAQIYMSNTLHRILGTEQGSCASLFIWINVLDPVLWSIANKYTCLKIITPAGASIDIIGDTYMDTTAIVCLTQDPDFTSPHTAQKLSKFIEEIAQEFARKLFSTGGSLSLNKYFWYLISWQWHEDGSATMYTIKDTPAEILLIQGYSMVNKAKITRFECDWARRTLGCHIYPKGNMTHKDPTVET